MNATPCPAAVPARLQPTVPTLLYPLFPPPHHSTVSSHSLDEYFQQFYGQLRQLAGRILNRPSSPTALSPTELVHETWLRLAGPRPVAFQNRVHFFATAIKTMRRIVIDRFRRKHAARHGGGRWHVNIAEVEVAAAESGQRECALRESLERLAARAPVQAALARLRFFDGLTLDQAAQALGLSMPTARRQWNGARDWLQRELEQFD